MNTCPFHTPLEHSPALNYLMSESKSQLEFVKFVVNLLSDDAKIKLESNQ